MLDLLCGMNDTVFAPCFCMEKQAFIGALLPKPSHCVRTQLTAAVGKGAPTCYGIMNVVPVDCQERDFPCRK